MSNIEKANVVEAALLEGDLGKLSPKQRVDHYMALCNSLGLNPLSKPFEYTFLNGKTILYVSKGATDQLRKLNGISLEVISKTREEELYVVEVKASTPDGRVDTEIGIVDLQNKRGEALANAMMKCLTKAKRRATLSICGLGMLDESEIDSTGAVPLQHSLDTGEITGPVLPPRTQRTKELAPAPAPAETMLQTPVTTAPGLAAISASDKEKILAAAKKVGWTKDKLKTHLTGEGYKKLDDIPSDKLDDFLNSIGGPDAISGSDSEGTDELFRAQDA
jgi:hypothetical protein